MAARINSSGSDWFALRPSLAYPSASFLQRVDDDLGLALPGASDLLVDPRPQRIGNVEAHGQWRSPEGKRLKGYALGLSLCADVDEEAWSSL